MFKDKHRNTETRCEIKCKVDNKGNGVSGDFSVNFEHISHLVLNFLLLTLIGIAGWLRVLLSCVISTKF